MRGGQRAHAVVTVGGLAGQVGEVEHQSANGEEMTLGVDGGVVSPDRGGSCGDEFSGPGCRR